MEIGTLFFLLDKIGIIAFAFGGVSDGVGKKLDLLGLLIAGVISAVGGGIIRDLLLARMPYAISNIDYLTFAFVASFIAIFIYYFRISIPYKIVIFADTIGLGAFAGTGIVISLTNHLSIFHTILFAATTAVGGGILKDILINEVPFVMKRQIYATAAIIGGTIAHLSYFLGVEVFYAAFVGISITILVRFYSINRKLNLPVIEVKMVKN